MRRASFICLMVAGLLAVGLTSAGAQAPYGPYQTDPIIAGGTDGTVWVTEVVGDQIWLGGTFANVRNHALEMEPDIASTNLGVIDLNTGLVREDRTFSINGPVLAITLAEDRVWIGGNFTQVNGQSRTRLAVFDAYSGQLLDPAPTANDNVMDLQFHDGWVYVAGEFNNVSGSSVARTVRIDPISGALDTSWTVPSVSSHVEAIATYGDMIVVGNKGTQARVYRISNPGAGNTRLNNTRVWDVEFSPDGTRINIADVDNTAKSFLVSGLGFSGDSENANWVDSGSDGDAQAIASTDDALWYGFHENYNNNSSIKMVKLDPVTGNRDTAWYVEIDSYWGVHNIQPTEQGLIVTGFFENVNGFEARRFALFPPVDPVSPARPLRPDGDVSCDGQAGVVDALLIAQFAVGQRTDHPTCPLPNPLTSLRLSRADVNIDGQVNIIDALLLAQCDIGLNNDLCPAN